MRKRGNKIFLSYAAADRELVQPVAAQLRNAGLEVWDPERDLLPGSEFASEIQQALESSKALLVFLSPKAMESRWVSLEISYALGAEHLSGRLIPIILRPTKAAPWILESLPQIRYEDPVTTGKQILDLLNKPAYAPQTTRRTG
ncbi:MAG: toll/interleukin-1 receptor domain-containing protein [Bryobacterales bacterium]|nr:toll/interleukin-1 receptor domain-containing protein [Bryobacterales bacterium]